jgi:glycosyltransferase involved in cell wall biosynthesis
MHPEHKLFPIVFLGTQMEIAGAQRMLLSQARWFHKKGYPVQAVFFYDKQGLAPTWQAAHHFPVISLDAWKQGGFVITNLLRLVRGLTRLIRILGNNIRAVVTFTPHTNVLALPIARWAGVPVRIGTHHGYIEGSSKIMARLHGWLTNSRLPSRMVAVSAQVRDYAIKQEAALPGRLTVIENGIEPLKMQSLDPAKRTTLRTEIGVTENGLMLLTVGRLTIQKGHTVLLDAISKLNRNETKLMFAFAGDGPQLKVLQNKTETLAISDHIRFLGVRHDINELLLAADVFVQPSLWEGLSLALLEALLAGLPVVATRVEGVIDVVDDSVSALLVPPNEPAALADAIQRLINDAGLRAKLGAAGKQRAQTNYSLDKMCLAYEQLMLDLANAA